MIMGVRTGTPPGKTRRETRKGYPGISLTRNFGYYLLIFFAALIFTQALRAKASNIFFGFIFFLPWVMFFYALSARATIRVGMLSESATIKKLDLYTYSIRVINESIIPYPFIDAEISLPQSDSVRCGERSVRFAMSPMAVYDIKNSVRFRFRGTYRIGVNCIYVYDFFRMIRVRVDIGAHSDVAVLPRRLNLKTDEVGAVSDSARESKKDPNSYEKIEISDIRDYRTGDPLKSIHWKLSSKAEDFMVRDYDTGSSKKTIVFCDMSARFPASPPERGLPPASAAGGRKRPGKRRGNTAPAPPPADPGGGGAEGGVSGAAADERVREAFGNELADRGVSRAAAREGRGKRRAARAGKEKRPLSEDAAPLPEAAVDVHALAEDRFYDDMNEYCADGVVELSVATVLRELREGNECTLLWFDRRSEAGFYLITLRSIEDFNAVYRLFATAPLCPADDGITRLSPLVGDTQDVKQFYVTSAIDPESLRHLCSLPGSGGGTGADEVVLYNPEERFAHPTERRLYIDGCRSQLASRGLRLAEGRID